MYLDEIQQKWHDSGKKSIEPRPAKYTRLLGNDSARGPPQSFLPLMRGFLQVLLVHPCILEQIFVEKAGSVQMKWMDGWIDGWIDQID